MTGAAMTGVGGGAAAGPRGLEAFVGRWQLSRTITDALGPDGRFEGEALFDWQGDGLIYTERGTLRYGTGQFQAERCYFWDSPQPGILRLRFADGRDFHQIELGQAATALHDCAPDIYRVAYDFADWPAWTSDWTVTGPRKDYTMHSRYTWA